MGPWLHFACVRSQPLPVLPELKPEVAFLFLSFLSVFFTCFATVVSGARLSTAKCGNRGGRWKNRFDTDPGLRYWLKRRFGHRSMTVVKYSVILKRKQFQIILSMGPWIHLACVRSCVCQISTPACVTRTQTWSSVLIFIFFVRLFHLLCHDGVRSALVYCEMWKQRREVKEQVWYWARSKVLTEAEIWSPLWPLLFLF